MKNIAKAICQVMAEANHVQKTGKNNFHGYAYASDADLLKTIQPAMAKAGLAMVPLQIASVDKQLDKGKVQTDVHVQYMLIHSSGETLTVQAIGRGIDKEDKGGYKAMTGALKYAMRQTFLIPTGDDPEVDSNAHEDSKPTPHRKPAPKKPSQKPAPQKPSQKPAQKKPSPKAADTPPCPKCGGDMFDFSAERRAGSKKPAYKCKNGQWNHKTKETDGCDGIIWEEVRPSKRNQSASDVFDEEDEIPF